MPTRTKMVLNNQQKTAARVIFGPELAARIVAQAQKAVDDLTTAVDGLKSAVAEFDHRLTKYEVARGADLAGRFYQSNGRPPAGLTGQFFGGK